MYADETGDLDMSGSRGTRRYFGFGTAVLPDGHGPALWQGLRLRCRLEQAGIRVPSGVHAKNDSHRTRTEVYELIASQRPRFDTTFLYKEHAENRIRSAGQVQLYKLAWYLHFKEIVREVSQPGDTIFAIIGSLHTHNKREAIRLALDDVCQQFADDRMIVPCIWDARSAWGLQVADYGLWAAQRILEGRQCTWFATAVEPTLQSTFMPWGQG